MESLIDKNTILLVGSAPSYPHGIVDPIDSIIKLALKYNTGMHIDPCLGGFTLGFLKDYQHIINFDR